MIEHVYQAFRPLAYGATGGDTTAAEVFLREDLPRAYQLPAGGKLSIRPGQDLSEQELALLDESVQHLLDLAYLPEAFYQDYFERGESAVGLKQWHRIQAALLDFIREDNWAREAGLSGQAFGKPDGPLASDELLPLLVQRLNQLTSLDGEHLLNRPLQLGEQNVYSRVLQYRLRTLGQYFDGEIIPTLLDQSTLIRTFNVLLLLGFKKREEINFSSKELPVEFFHLLGDAHGMFGQYLQQHPDRVLFYQLPEVAKMVAHSQWLIVWKSSFVYADKEKVFQVRIRQETVLDYEQLKVYIRSRGVAATAFHSIQNRFGLRLLQLKLWMAGFYYGRIDGWWGGLSHQALLDFLEQEGVEKEKQFGRFIAPVEDNYRAINFTRLGELLKEYDAPTGDDRKHEQELLESMTASEEEALQKALYSNDGNIRTFYQESHQNRRRLYFGMKSLVVSALRGIKKILGWIKRAVQKVVGAVISFFKAVTKRIREGMLVFAESFRRFLHFVLHKPVISMELKTTAIPVQSHFVLTRFAIDSDVVNLYSSSLSPATMSGHLVLLHRLTTGLGLFLAIATEVIDLITALGTLTTPIGWIRLGFWIAGKVKEILNRK